MADHTLTRSQSIRRRSKVDPDAELLHSAMSSPAKPLPARSASHFARVFEGYTNKGDFFQDCVAEVLCNSS